MPQSFDAALDDVRVSVAAEVARHYFELRGVQQQIAVTERSLTNARETLRLSQVRRDAGIGEEQDVASASARVAGVESILPPLRAAVAEREHRLAVLNGVRPGELAVDLSPRPYPTLAKALPLGDPSSLLRRRPDVRAAERRLAEATAREGVAAADLFPRVTVSGFLGFVAGRGSLFGTSDSRAWAVTPALTWAAFDLGSARARLRGTEAVSRETLAVYEQTVLRALEEAENALVAYREQQRRLVSLADQARESGRAASHRAREVSRRPGRLPGAPRRRAHGASGTGSRRPGRSRSLHRRREHLQVARRNSSLGGSLGGSRPPCHHQRMRTRWQRVMKARLIINPRSGHRLGA